MSSGVLARCARTRSTSATVTLRVVSPITYKERRDGGANLDPANGFWRCWSCHGRKTAEARGKRAHEVLRCEVAPRADGALPR